MKSERIPFSSRRHLGAGSKVVEEVTERHESFGMVRISRVTGKSRAFGSHLGEHHSMFQFTVQRAVRTHTNLNRDFIHSDHEAECTQLIEFEMSPTQFIDLMTSLNVGDGVPCTIKSVGYTQMEEMPEEVDTEAQMIVAEFRKFMLDIDENLSPYVDEIEELLSKKSVAKGVREGVMKALWMMRKQLNDHAPYAMKQFVESTDKTVATAKGEIDALMTTTLMGLGMEHLRQLKSDGGDVDALVRALDVEAMATKGLPEGEES